MSSRKEEKVSRRKFVSTATGIVVVAAAAGAAYYLSQPSPTPSPSPTVPSPTPIDWSDFRGIYKYKGKTYGIPWRTGGEVLWYNVDMFDKAGIGHPEPHKFTWEDFLDAAQKLTKGNQYGIALMGAIATDFMNVSLLPLPWSYGARQVSKDLKKCLYNSATMVERLQQVIDWNLKHRVVAPDTLATKVTDLPSLVAKGVCAMTFTDHVNYPDILKINPDAKIGVSSYPAGPNGEVCVHQYAWCWSIPAGAKHAEEAFELIKFLEDPERAPLITPGVCARISALEHPKYDEMKNNPLTRYAWQSSLGFTDGVAFTGKEPLYDSVHWVDVLTRAAAKLSEVWSGKAKLEPTLDALTSEIDGILDGN
jgi:multiple sugar transport system substrate-binding protein